MNFYGNKLLFPCISFIECRFIVDETILFIEAYVDTFLRVPINYDSKVALALQNFCA